MYQILLSTYTTWFKFSTLHKGLQCLTGQSIFSFSPWTSLTSVTCTYTSFLSIPTAIFKTVNLWRCITLETLNFNSPSFHHNFSSFLSYLFFYRLTEHLLSAGSIRMNEAILCSHKAQSGWKGQASKCTCHKTMVVTDFCTEHRMSIKPSLEAQASGRYCLRLFVKNK